MDAKRYRSSFSTGILRSTIALSAVLLLAACFIFYQLLNTSIGSVLWWSLLLPFAFIVFSLLYAFASQITGLYITDDTVVIKKMLGQITIRRDEIKQVQAKHNMLHDIRLWGISGLFGHIGLFGNRASGRYHAYIKNSKTLVFIETSGKNYVVSCDDATEVIENLRFRSQGS